MLTDNSGNRMPEKIMEQNDPIYYLVPVNNRPEVNKVSSKLPKIHAEFFKASVVKVDKELNAIVIRLEGRMEQEQSNELEDFFSQFVIRQEQCILCDMSDLLSLCSSGWDLLAGQLQRLRRYQGAFWLCAMNKEMDRSFRSLDFDKIFHVFPSVSDAESRLGLFRENSEKPITTLVPFNREDLSYLSLDSKIRDIVGKNPNLPNGQMRKLLKSDMYGNVKISPWKFMTKLRSMNLGSLKERYRYFRSA